MAKLGIDFGTSFTTMAVSTDDNAEVRPIKIRHCDEKIPTVMFYTELAKHLKMQVKMEFVSLSSYGDSEKSSGKVNALNLHLPNLEGKKVMVVEDIVDTGLTLDFLMNFLRTKCSAKEVRLCALLDKKCARKFPVHPDFCAFDIDDKFIVGFGLDYKELYRNISFIGYLE